MDAHLVEATIKAHLTEIRNRVDKAAGIGAADACAGAGAGFYEKGLEVALDIEQLLNEANALLNAASFDQPDDPTKLNWPGTTERAIILLRYDWLSRSIGALL